MPAVQPPAKVLVTGVNGYIAAWLVQTLLERGYFVRGTVRSEEKGKHLKEIFKSYAETGLFELVVVADITEEGAFDEAVKGVDVVEHTASPFHFNADDPQELIVPAVQGTTSVLQSIVKNAPNVKRVVVTSSCVAVMREDTEPSVFTEENWNEQSIQWLEANGKNALNDTKYRASKTLAEKAAWALYESHKSSVKWDLVVINPPYVFGPAINEAPAPSSLGTSLSAWFHAITQADHGDQSLTAASIGWVDVRDVAEAHVRAIEKEAAGNERIIVAAGCFTWQDFLDVAAKLYPDVVQDKGVPGSGKDVLHYTRYNTAKQSRILGIKYRTMEDVARDSIEDFRKRGWVQ